MGNKSKLRMAKTYIVTIIPQENNKDCEDEFEKILKSNKAIFNWKKYLCLTGEENYLAMYNAKHLWKEE